MVGFSASGFAGEDVADIMILGFVQVILMNAVVQQTAVSEGLRLET